MLPLPHVPVVRDLVWDMDDFFDKYEYVKPWLIRNSQTPETELLQSPEDRKYLNMPIDCILCAACYSSCPSVWTEEHYLGPAALLKAYRFEVDSRDDAGKDPSARSGTTSAVCTAATRSPTARRRAPRSSTPPRASSGSRGRPCAAACSAAASRA